MSSARITQVARQIVNTCVQGSVGLGGFQDVSLSFLVEEAREVGILGQDGRLGSSTASYGSLCNG